MYVTDIYILLAPDSYRLSPNVYQIAIKFSWLQILNFPNTPQTYFDATDVNALRHRFGPNNDDANVVGLWVWNLQLQLDKRGGCGSIWLFYIMSPNASISSNQIG